MTVEAILFDMDGVVVDSMRVHADAWKRVLGEFGLELDDIDILRREGMSGRQSVEDIFLEKERPVPGEIEFNELLAKKHILFEQSRIHLFPFVEEMLEWIGNRGIRSALVTGSLRRSVHHVMPDNVFSSFDAVISAENVVRGKPDPEPYTRALDSLGARPEHSLVIENSPMGIRSARAAGITCFALETTLPRRYLIEANRIFKDHRDLFEFLKSNIQQKRHR